MGHALEEDDVAYSRKHTLLHIALFPQFCSNSFIVNVHYQELRPHLLEILA